jgi:paraquat-inducible protein A
MRAAASAGFVLCEECFQTNRVEPGLQAPACARCGGPLHARRPNSLARSWAYLLAAVVLYIPANVLPVMESGGLFQSQSDTIWSGVVYLWKTHSEFLAVIVFTASMLIPIAKIFSLAWLLVEAQRRSRRAPLRRARLYRATHYIGRWSMVDMFVGATLVGLVQLGAFGSILPGPGAIFFAAVVVLTMLASEAFDPRLTWDPVSEAKPA